MRTAQGAVALRRGQHHRLAGETVQTGSMHRIVAEIDMFAEALLPPELHGLVAILVGKNVDDIGLSGHFGLLRLASGQNKQAGTAP